jgi:hypothetical protein
MDYAEARALLATARDRSAGKPIANNTRLYPGASRVLDGHDSIGLTLHATEVLTFYSNGDIALDSGGWHTVTTSNRINNNLPAPWGVASHRMGGVSEWWLWNGSTPVVPFTDGLVITASGCVRLGWPKGALVMSRAQIQAERDRIQAERDTRQTKRIARLRVEHGRGEVNAYGSVRVYRWREKDYQVVQRYHPRSYDGRSYDCPRCAEVTA